MVKNKFLKNLFKKLPENKQIDQGFIISFFMVILFICILIYSVTLFYTGYHSMDQGVNGMIFEEKTDIVLYDIASDFKAYTTEELYINGINSMRAAFYIFGLSMFMIGYYIMLMAAMYEHIKRV